MAHQLASFQSRLSRGLGITPAQAAIFLDKAIPVIQLGDVTGFDASDTFYERPIILRGGIGPTAAVNSHVQCFNPLESGVDVILDLAVVRLITAGDVNLLTHDAALAAASTRKAFRDRRIRGLPAASAFQEDTAAALGTLIGNFSLPAATSETVILDFLLSPGTGIMFRNGLVNDNIDVTFYGYERNRE